jgi:hypothetical protein
MRSSKLPVATATNRCELVVVTSLWFLGNHARVTVDNRVAFVSSDGPPLYRPSAALLLSRLSLSRPRERLR